MSKIEYAKKLLKYFKNSGISFDSKLKETSYKEVIKEEKVLRFFKYKYNDFEITEDLAEQICNFNKAREYKSMLKSFEERKRRTENGLFIFTYKVTPDYSAANVANLLGNTCGIILNVYKQKKDTPIFDKNVSEIMEILDKNIEKEPVGDYGVIYGYTIDKTPQLTPEETEKIIEFQYITLGPQTQDITPDSQM